MDKGGGELRGNCHQPYNHNPWRQYVYSKKRHDELYIIFITFVFFSWPQMKRGIQDSSGKQVTKFTWITGEAGKLIVRFWRRNCNKMQTLIFFFAGRWAIHVAINTRPVRLWSRGYTLLWAGRLTVWLHCFALATWHVIHTGWPIKIRLWISTFYF